MPSRPSSQPPSPGAQPANDDCANATVVGSLPFTDEVDTSLATNEGGEPSSACSGGANVWYLLPPSGSDRNVYVDVFRSDSTEANATIYPGTCGAFGAALGQCATGDDHAAATIPAGTTARRGLRREAVLARPTASRRWSSSRAWPGRPRSWWEGGQEGLSGSPTGFSPLPLALPARIQLQQPSGPCWEATFDSAGIQSATATTLRAVAPEPTLRAGRPARETAAIAPR